MIPALLRTPMWRDTVDMSDPTIPVSSVTVFSPFSRASTISSLEGWAREEITLALSVRDSAADGIPTSGDSVFAI